MTHRGRDKWPMYESLREDIRMRIYETENLIAWKRAANAYLSLRCIAGDHGCRNDGTSCLCRCHDKKEDRREKRTVEEG